MDALFLGGSIHGMIRTTPDVPEVQVPVRRRVSTTATTAMEIASSQTVEEYVKVGEVGGAGIYCLNGNERLVGLFKKKTDELVNHIISKHMRQVIGPNKFYDVS